ncbi:MAG: RNHCP domain-containing protein, partial [Bdellovibrionales bacterium]|nr:RNHCP domain-containing protein [Bdellovibrionales bacterium]
HCRGLMKPIAIQVKTEQRWLVHQCERCGAKKRVKILSSDNFETQLAIMQGVH